MNIENLYNEIKEGLFEKVVNKLNTINITESFDVYKKNTKSCEASFDDWITKTETSAFIEVLSNSYGITDEETIEGLYDYILNEVYLEDEEHNIPNIIFNRVKKIL